jgi:intraflagellar transport protein 80
MRFKIKKLDRSRHTDIVSCAGWSNGGELFSVSDDLTVLKWDMNGELDASPKVMDLD